MVVGQSVDMRGGFSEEWPSSPIVGRPYWTCDVPSIRRRASRYRIPRQKYKSMLFSSVIFMALFNIILQIWDLRTGSIFDAFGYDNPITSMQFDSRRIVSAAGEPVAKVYDKTEGRHWDCGGADGSTEIVERVKVKDGYLVEGRVNGTVGIWAC